MTFEELVRYLATPAALGVVSSIALAIIRQVWPQLDEGWAFVASAAAAAVMYLLAAFVVPLLPQLPAELELYWPAIVFVAQQVWYWIMRDKTPLYYSKNKRMQMALRG